MLIFCLVLVKFSRPSITPKFTAAILFIIVCLSFRSLFVSCRKHVIPVPVISFSAENMIHFRKDLNCEYFFNSLVRLEQSF